jgi:erythromycin esterase-like protein/predicted phosphoribosyltransferase
MRFPNRSDAGRQLAEKLDRYANRDDVVVLALPRGGLPVAYEVASRLGAPLDVFLVRKLGVPAHPELAMGAIAQGGVQVLSDDLIADLGVPAAVVERVAARERLELERRDRLYRGGRAPVEVRGRIVILVDDGLATGSTMQAAATALRALQPARIVAAAPVGAADTCRRLAQFADEVVCVTTPDPFNAVGLWYEDFAQTTDDEVRELLWAEQARRTGAAGGAGQAGGAGRAGETGGVAEVIRRHAVPLTEDGARDYDALIDAIGDARLVLLGEASHGTHEFYRARAVITRRLIEEKDFAAVSVEADWPDAYRINRYVRGAGPDQGASEALGDFGRFPTWMWRNADVLDFVGWLRAHNDVTPADRRVGFYGLDLYSLRASMQAVLAYLETIDPAAAERARRRYACFDQFGEEPQEYGYAAAYRLTPSCERDVLNQLMDLQRRRGEYASRDGRVAADDFFFAEQNARLVTNAEAYYRAMFAGRSASWNLRDRHMFETIRELLTFLERSRPAPRMVVWAHNSHLGDARATEMGRRGELNVGQLIREAYGAGAFLVGFTTHTGTVTAAREWSHPAERKPIRPSLAGSYERLFHDTGLKAFLLLLANNPDLASALDGPLLERAIGVIYAPETERQSHYFDARLPLQFDAVIHVDDTRAVEPLDRSAGWEAGELADTFPSGL